MVLSMVNVPLPLWSTVRLLVKITEPVLLPIVKFPSAPEATVKFALPEAAEKLRFVAEVPVAFAVKRIVTLPSARSLKFKLRMILAAPKKEGLVLVFELPKVMSAEVPKVGVVLPTQLVLVDQFPLVVPFQVCACA